MRAFIVDQTPIVAQGLLAASAEFQPGTKKPGQNRPGFQLRSSSFNQQAYRGRVATCGEVEAER